MAIHLTHYSKVKDKYCIAYLGNCNEYILQLKHLRPYFENAFPGIEISMCFKDDCLHFVEGEDRIVPYSKIKEQKRQFAYIREILCNMQEHPIEAFLKESDIEVPCLEPETASNAQGIFSQGCLPTKSMTRDQIDWASQVQGVVGVENEELFQAALDGAKVTLVDTGLGGKFYSKMFPNIDVVAG